MRSTAGRHRIVIVGGGFAGLHCALALKKANAQVTLIDRRNFHLFQPLLYQVATGGLSPANIAAPLRGVLASQTNTRVLLGEVVDMDEGKKELVLSGRDEVFNRVPYDTLIIATGATHSYFGKNHWQDLAPGLKSIEDATELRQRLLTTFEAAEYAAWRGAPPQQVLRLMTFVVVGAGPTGVELAGALGEITRDTFRGNFRHINPRDASIHLVEAGERILVSYTPDLSEKAAKSLHHLGVQIRTSTRVTDIQPDHVVLTQGERSEIIATRSVIWAAGVQASPLSAIIKSRTGVETDRVGRVMVEADCSVPDHPNVFVLGDLAHFAHTADKKPLPGTAAVAMQQGAYLGKTLAKRLAGQPSKNFVYRDYGKMATIGRGRAVVDVHGVRFAGLLAWLAWLFVHVLKLVGFHNKFMVAMQWAWLYLTHNRSARLITASPSPMAMPVNRTGEHYINRTGEHRIDRTGERRIDRTGERRIEDRRVAAPEDDTPRPRRQWRAF